MLISLSNWKTVFLFAYSNIQITSKQRRNVTQTAPFLIICTFSFILLIGLLHFAIIISSSPIYVKYEFTTTLQQVLIFQQVKRCPRVAFSWNSAQKLAYKNHCLQFPAVSFVDRTIHVAEVSISCLKCTSVLLPEEAIIELCRVLNVHRINRFNACISICLNHLLL